MFESHKRIGGFQVYVTVSCVAAFCFPPRCDCSWKARVAFLHTFLSQGLFENGEGDSLKGRERDTRPVQLLICLQMSEPQPSL